MSVGKAWNRMTTCVWWPCGNPGVELRYTLELGLGTRSPRFVAWPLELGLGTRNARSTMINRSTVFALHCVVLPCVPIKMQGFGLLHFTLGYSTIGYFTFLFLTLPSENRENKGLPSLGDLCREFIAKDHKYYRIIHNA